MVTAQIDTSFKQGSKKSHPFLIVHQQTEAAVASFEDEDPAATDAAERNTRAAKFGIVGRYEVREREV